MTRHHYTLEHVAHALASCAGTMVTECWSQERGRCVLRLTRDREDIFLELHVTASESSVLIRPDTARARKNSRDIFPDLIGERVVTATKQEQDRIVSLWFTSCTLHVQCHSGPTANVILVREGIVIDAARDRERLLGSAYAVRPFEAPLWHTKSDATVIDAIARDTMLLGEHYARECCHRASIAPDRMVASLTEHERALIDATMHDVRRACRNATTFYVLDDQHGALFSLLPLHGRTVLRTTDDLFDALRVTVSRRDRARRLAAAREPLVKRLRAESTKLRRTLAAMEADVAAAARSTQYRHEADLLMSLPPSTQITSTALLVQDWDGTDRTIAVKEDLSVIENAQRLYAKAKSSEQALAERERRRPVMLQRLERIERDLDIARTSDDITTLERMAAQNLTAGDPSAAASPYRVFVLDEQHTLYVGKSAANNDELTMRFAKQNDWWLHARGVSGSHAVLKGVTGTKPPKPVLEAAAAITAYYSGARNASYVPVVYTQRKYVRKPKGAAVGAVVLEREDVVMVKPALP